MMTLRPWQLSLLLAGFCAALLSLVVYRRYYDQTTNIALLERLPAQEGSIHLFVDIQQLREAGLLELLSGSRAAEDTDYRTFVEETQFDYRRDLDAVFASFIRGDSVFLLRGRFAWSQIQQSAMKAGAKCVNGYCELETRRPGRFLSFYPAFPNVLGVGIGASGGVASSSMLRRKPGLAYAPPDLPFWISTTGTTIEKSDLFPVGGKALISAVKSARRVTLGVGAAPAGMGAEMRATFTSQADADKCKAHLDEMTDMLRKFLARASKTPDPREFAGVLAAGQFERTAHNVVGRWPIDRRFLESLADVR